MLQLVCPRGEHEIYYDRNKHVVIRNIILHLLCVCAFFKVWLLMPFLHFVLTIAHLVFLFVV